MHELSLAQWQQQFTAMLNGAQAHAYNPDRFAIYERTIRASLIDALRSIFSVTEMLVGEQFFAAMAERFIRAHMPKSACLQDYGAELPAFIESFPPAQSVSYLADVARLEWARHRAYWSADSAVLTLQDLQHIDESDYADLCLPLHASVTLFSSHYAAVSVWEAHVNMEDEASSTLHVDPLAGPEYCAVRRGRALKVEVLRMAEAEWTFLHALQDGQPLEAAIERGLAVDEAFDIQAALASHITQGSFAQPGMELPIQHSRETAHEQG